mmetsp:Transcript_39814/g.100358  ORF Transcript_39814/g.100358 Transcript_39814/m.100358 type:complete len:205 (+) Transcript_39814:249-863(+)|eukprot:CAMPEP_0177651566 /NCGR_PEP_ID=MMETSP0447-20121125/12629_1 /TAXON_ID=0 /ORGANISM="Stygamoeba regulata, Strain BSH-02190019" /LENGTH=204 /DNA_ID=CAMNT_0019154681 /DNA_START=223 /DNA_END=837 /DNA_ORIENTATION=+
MQQNNLAKELGKALNSFDFAQTVLMPTMAAFDAQEMACTEALTFIKMNGFTGDKLRYVKWRYWEQGRPKIRKFPYIALLPIPYFALQSVSITFSATLHAAMKQEEKTSLAINVDVGAQRESETDKENSEGTGRKTTSSSANVSVGIGMSQTEFSQKSTSKTMTFTVTAQITRDELPSPLQALMSALAGNIQQQLTVEQPQPPTM